MCSNCTALDCCRSNFNVHYCSWPLENVQTFQTAQYCQQTDIVKVFYSRSFWTNTCKHVMIHVTDFKDFQIPTESAVFVMFIIALQEPNTAVCIIWLVGWLSLNWVCINMIRFASFGLESLDNLGAFVLIDLELDLWSIH